MIIFIYEKLYYIVI